MGRISCELRIKRFLTRHETTITQPQNLTDVTHRPFYSHRKRNCSYNGSQKNTNERDGV